MKRSLLLCFLTAAGLSASANSLLTAPVSGSLGHSRLAGMSMASNGTDVVLLLADELALYAVDIADNDPSELAANAITSIPDFVNSKLVPVAGGAALTVLDIEVNPISKSVYVLAESSSASYVFKVRNDGADVTLLNLGSIDHSTMGWGAAFSVNAMTWGNNMLYASSGGFSLNGAVAAIPAPFVHGSTITQRSTSMFKSNWGGTYFTDAPLETMAYGKVGGTERLMGVTTCAPGFSMEASSVSGSGLLEVKEDFNVNTGVSAKVIFQHHDSKDWLFDLHDNYLYCIGESLLDGSPVTSGLYNKDAVLLRTTTADPAPGIPADVFKRFTGTYNMISYWDDYRLVVLEAGGTLKMLQTADDAPGLSVPDISADNKLSLYPNPAHRSLQVSLKNAAATTLQVFTMDGRLVQSRVTSDATATLDLSGLAAGQYLLKAVTAAGNGGQHIFVVQ